MSKKKAVAVQSNNLIESRYILTEAEQKLCLAMISKIKPDDINLAGFEIKVSEMAEMLDINLKYAYLEIQKTTKRLMGRVIQIPEEKGWLLTHWVSSCRYHHEHGTVTFKFDENLKPYLLQLREEFTKVNIDIITQFQSIYTIRIYQLIKSFAGIGWREIEISELKNMLGLKPDQYNEYRDFNKRVLSQAQKEMDAVDENGTPKSDLTFKIEKIKECRKIAKIKFIIIKNNMDLACLTKKGIGNAAKKSLSAISNQKNPSISWRFPEYWNDFLEYCKKKDPSLLPIINSDGPECPIAKYYYGKWLDEAFSR